MITLSFDPITSVIIYLSIYIFVFEFPDKQCTRGAVQAVPASRDADLCAAGQVGPQVAGHLHVERWHVGRWAARRTGTKAQPSERAVEGGEGRAGTFQRNCKPIYFTSNACTACSSIS